MFSRRFRWSLESNRLSRTIEEKKAAGARILNLTESNPTRVGFDYPVEEILGALAGWHSMSYAPAPRGSIAAREAVAAYYAERKVRIDPERIHLTSSTSEAYAWLFKLLADPGQSILVPRPSYPLFDFLASLEGVEIRQYELHYAHHAGWQIDLDSIESAIGPDTRAIVVVSPNNPTGSFVKPCEAGRLNEICSRRGAALIADEVFGDFGFDEDGRRTGSLAPNDEALTFVMSGLSKVLALPQMKLGWIVTNGPPGIRDEAVERLDLIADTFLSPGAPAQNAAPLWLPLRRRLQEQILERVRGNLERLAAIAEDSPCRVLKVEGGWYATLEVPRHFSEEDWVLMFLEKDDVLAHPGYFFDFQREAFLVLSLLPETETFSEAVERIFARVASY
jgi:hypothetical protein